MKYNNLTLGQIEAIVNKIGGIERVKEFLSEKPIVTNVSLNEKILSNVWKSLNVGTFEAFGDIYLEIFRRKNFTDGTKGYIPNLKLAVASIEEQISLVSLTVEELGFKNGATYKNICSKAKEIGLEPCPQETCFQLCLQYTKEDLKGWFNVVMETVTNWNGDESILTLISNGNYLGICSTAVEFHNSGNLFINNEIWPKESVFVFCFRK